MGFLPALALMALLLAAGAMAAASFSAAEGGEGAVRLFLVDEDDSELSRLAVTMLRSQDFVTASLRLERSTRENAIEGLREGRCAGVLILPEGYLEAILTGIPYEAELYVSRSLSGHAEVVEELIRAGETMMSAGQIAVFSGERLLAKEGASPEEHLRFLEEVNPALLKEALTLTREGTRVELVGYADTGMALEEHYLVTWMALALSLGPFFFRRLWIDDLGILPRLISAGVRPWDYLWPKVLLTAVCRLFLLLPSLPLLGLHPGPGAWGWLLLAMFWCAVIDGGLLLGMGDQAAPASFAIAVIGLFLAGGVYPRRLLPPTLVTASRFLPFGVLRGLLSPVVGVEPGLWEILAAILWACLAVSAALLRLERARRGGDAL